MSESSWEDVPFVVAKYYNMMSIWGGEPPREPDADDIEKQRVQHAERVARWKEWTAIGDLNYPSVPRYDVESYRCKKCGETRHKVGHCSQTEIETCCKIVGRREHLHIACKRCKHDQIRRVVEDEL
jgi:hypothetical protein